MDQELLIALWVMWVSSTVLIVTTITTVFFKDQEAFHPHSTDVELRHSMFVVVGSRTECKLDCAVKHISSYISPRGSSSSKYFTVFATILGVSGFLGTSRWQAVGDATQFQALLSHIGFACILLAAGLEWDIVPERYLEDKLIVTGWLLEKMGLDKELPFRLSPFNPEFLQFIRDSSDIYHLFEEDRYIQTRETLHKIRIWKYPLVWSLLHLIGASGFVGFISASIILNDYAESKIAIISGVSFGIFSFMGLLTGNYLPLIRSMRAWVLVWNPFVREPHYMYKLQKAVEAYKAKRYGYVPVAGVSESDAIVSPSTPSSSIKRRKSLRVSKKPQRENSTNSFEGNVLNRTKGENEAEEHLVAAFKSLKEHVVLSPKELAAAVEADKYLDTFSLKFARSDPILYLRFIGQFLIWVEMLALLTPVVAMGIQWGTALCDGPPMEVMLDLVWLGMKCTWEGSDCSNLSTRHCIFSK